MDEPVMKRLDRAVRILSEQHERGSSSSSSSSSNEVENSNDASTSVVESKNMGNNGQGSNSNSHNKQLLPIDSNEQILRFYSDIEGVCQTREGCELILAMLLNATSGTSGSGGSSTTRGPSVNPVGSGLLHKNTKIQHCAYDILSKIEEVIVLKRVLNSFLLATYERRKNTAQ